jgi:hypothetical protein
MLQNVRVICRNKSTKKGNFISKVIYHFNDGNVFVCAFQNSLREKKENTDEGIVHTYHNPDRQN